jgi:hypothetical protein
MREEAGDLGKIVVYYAVWTIVCATVAGLAVAILHLWRFSYHPTVASMVFTLVGDTEVALAVATGQGAAALATGGLLARGGRALQGTVLLGLLVGGFDLLLYLLQMLVPATELGWAPDMGILIAATVLITVYGAASAKLPA